MNAPLATSAASSSTDSDRLRVLVVEDDPVVRRLLRHCLHRAGLQIVTASSGEDAIEKFQSGKASAVNLVVTDGVMPGIDGFEVARFFSRQDPPVRVVMVSGYLNHFTSRSDIPENLEAFFAKPFSPDEVVAKVLELLGVTA